ncbi:MAG: DNA mismatch repair protein MutS [Holophagales bacterium]|nr:DNA mismatch repair protein MutS [Holophagales bacterium]MYF97250.1 DNA mismatch repair protein MutS [Holophagales bacterium]
MLRHYLTVKAEYPDAILLYRMGDFFELFFEDATTAAPVLDVALTARQKGTASEAPMCGVPHHSVESYIARLLDAGYKVAVCDQVEDPAQARGLVRREVTRVVTPGTISDLEMLDQNRPNYLAGIRFNGGAGAGAFLDVSTGEFFVRRWPDAALAVEDLERLAPREILTCGGDFETGSADPGGQLPAWIERAGVPHTAVDGSEAPRAASAERALRRQFQVENLRGFGLVEGEAAVAAAALVLEYARRASRSEIDHVTGLEVQHDDRCVVVDDTTLRNLEVFRHLQHQGGRTLVDVLDLTRTGPGARALRRWLSRPLRDAGALRERHDAVDVLLRNIPLRESLRSRFKGMADLERLTSRLVLGRISPREAAALRETLRDAPATLAAVAGLDADLLGRLGTTDALPALRARFDAILAETPASLNDGGVIAAGVDAELDRLRSLARDGKGHIAALEAGEREATGIPSLKVGYNRVFGYYLEVRKTQQERVPDHYVRRQTLTNAERYVTEDLKKLEEQILGAESGQLALEQEIFESLRAEAAREAAPLLALASALARLDCLTALAEVAGRYDYVRPRMLAASGRIEIREGRHPVVERSTAAIRGASGFVPNDVCLDRDREQIILLTGPNMGGKSTYLRQTALIVLMAHAGSFVPAQSAEIGLVDRVFTRVGASDDLARGESTFMVEMVETANILRHATPDSLVVLDEVGRGTSTYDGLSLAWAIIERLHEHNGSLALFATHYHELTGLPATLSRVRNSRMAVKEWQDQILFLHRVAEGRADKSYGLHVARLAGVPSEVIERAAAVLSNIESQQYSFSGKPRVVDGASGAPPGPGTDQLALWGGEDEAVIEALKAVDVDQLTPLAALNLLQTLRSRLRVKR